MIPSIKPEEGTVLKIKMLVSTSKETTQKSDLTYSPNRSGQGEDERSVSQSTPPEKLEV